MAKEAKAVETTEVAPQKTVKVKTVEQKPSKPEWEIKERIYYLTGNKSPLTLKIPGRHTKKHALLYFDEATGKQREIRYATNQDSPLVDEQKGEVTLGHIMFRDGSLTVPKQQQNLQKLLSLYHPLKGKLYQEFSAVEEAEDELDTIELQVDALNAAREMDIDQAEAIMRVEVGSKVSQMSSKELKRDLLLFAKNNPQLFIELANDENVQLRNVAIVASETGVINLSQDQRTFTWGSNGRKLMNVPFDENPYSAMAAWFKTDEGVEVYKSIEKKLL
jgi:frataxin-like iron-binding protein CyaY